LQASAVRAVGITNQRETTVLWNRKTGQPVHHAIVWQDRRAEPACAQLREQGHAATIQAKTGLLVDAYFSGTKLQWMLDHVPGARDAAERGELAFGTVDSWLMWKLTHGQVHVTDVSNAARTMLFNVHTNQWDDELLALLRIPKALLPEVLPSSAHFGDTAADLLGHAIRIGGVAGDQQSALFGQACFDAGMAKNTYGTGCFMLMHTGGTFQTSQNGLLTTSAAQATKQPEFAMEGSVFVGGAVVQWLRDGLRAITNSSEVQALAESVPDSGGVMMVPAFTGLGAPYWKPDARGTITGLTRGTTHGPHCARRAREHCLPERRPAAGHEPRRRGRRWRASERAARGRRRLRQRPADAVPGRPAGHSGGAPRRDRDHGPGRGLPGGAVERGVRSTDELSHLWRADRRFVPTLSNAPRAGADGELGTRRAANHRRVNSRRSRATALPSWPLLLPPCTSHEPTRRIPISSPPSPSSAAATWPAPSLAG
jgi:glycerol kinase